VGSLRRIGRLDNFGGIWRKVYILKQLVIRDVSIRYRGSWLGVVWSILTPVFMLLVYTFVFSEVFNAKWGESHTGKFEFALILYAGLLVFQFFSDTLARSPILISQNSNYVKKVVFPLELLSISIVGSSLFQLAINLLMLLIAVFCLTGVIAWTALLVPVIILPTVLLASGLSWMVSSIGVYFRDVNHIISLMLSGLLFATPIFYPIQAIQGPLKVIILLNPLSHTVENMRRLVVWGELPQLDWLALEYLGGCSVLIIGYLIFGKLRGGFADEL
jgi:lipopolysaccharide transport system permease protein